MSLDHAVSNAAPDTKAAWHRLVGARTTADNEESQSQEAPEQVDYTDEPESSPAFASPKSQLCLVATWPLEYQPRREPLITAAGQDGAARGRLGRTRSSWARPTTR